MISNAEYFSQLRDLEDQYAAEEITRAELIAAQVALADQWAVPATLAAQVVDFTAEQRTVLDQIGLLNLSGTVVSVGDLPGGAANGDTYVVTSNGHAYVRLTGVWKDLGTYGGRGGIAVFPVEGAPDAGMGMAGDLALDLETGDFYGPKTSDGWGAPVLATGLEAKVAAAESAKALAEGYRDEISSILTAGALGINTTDPTNSGYSTFTSNGPNLLSYGSAAGAVSARFPIPNRTAGQQVVVLAAVRNAMGQVPYIRLYPAAGSTAASASVNLIADGVLRPYVLTVDPGFTATRLFFGNSAAASGDLFLMVLDGSAPYAISAAGQLAKLVNQIFWDLQRLDVRPDVDLDVRAIGAVTGPLVNASLSTLTPYGLTDYAISTGAGGGSAQQPIGAIAMSGTATLLYQVDATAVGSIRAALFKNGVGTVESVKTLVADGGFHAVELTATTNSADRLSISGGANASGRVRYVLIPGSMAANTVQGTNLQALLLSLLNVLSQPGQDQAVRGIGLPTAVCPLGSFTTLTAAGLGDIVVTAPSGGANAQQPCKAMVQGEKATLIYRFAPGAVGTAKAKLYKIGTGTSGTEVTLNTDGDLHVVELDTVTRDASGLNWNGGANAAWRVRYALLAGSLAATSVESSGLRSAFLAALNAIAQPTIDATVRGAGMIQGAMSQGTFATFTLNGLGDFEATSTSIVQRGQNIAALAQGEKCTLVYRFDPLSVGNVRGQLQLAGIGTSNAATPLNMDGRVHALEMTASTRAADQLLWYAGTGSAFRVRYALFPGAPSDTTVQGTSLAQALSALGALLDGAGVERWAASETDILHPSHAYFVAGRPKTFYGRNLLRGRKRQQEIETLLTCQPSNSASGRPLARHLTRDADIAPADLAGATFEIVVRDPAVPDQVKARVVTWHEASAVQAGAPKICFLGDSLVTRTSAALYWRVQGSGATFDGIGVRSTDRGDGAMIPNEGRAGWAAVDYLGKRRTAPGGFSNPFLRPAVSGDFAAHPAYCFDDAGTGLSYADNPGLASYSIFDPEYWRAALSPALPAADRLILILQLSRNDLGATAPFAATAAQMVTWQSWMVDRFKAAFANLRVIIASEGIAAFSVNGDSNWPTTAAVIEQKLALFDNRTAEHIYVAPAWAHMAAEVGFPTATPPVTNLLNGTQTRTIDDWLHPSEISRDQLLPAQQWAEAVLPVLLWVHENT